MKMKTNLWSRLFGGSSDTAVKEQQTQEAKEQSFRVLPFEELPRLQAMNQNAEALRKISAEYYKSCYDFIKFFPQKIAELEQQKNAELKKIEERYSIEKSKEVYAEKAVHVGGVKCMARDDDAIDKMKENILREEYEETQKIVCAYEKKQTKAREIREGYQKDIEECYRLEQTLALQQLPYEAIVPTRILKAWIEEMPELYDFEGKIDNEGKFTAVLYIPTYSGQKNNTVHWELAEKGLLDLNEEMGFRRTCFGKDKHMSSKEKELWYVELIDPKLFGSYVLREVAKSKYGISVWRVGEITGRIIFPEPTPKASKRMLQWLEKGYQMYTIAEEVSFAVEIKKIEFIQPLTDPISATNIENMTVLIAQYGDFFALEKQLLEKAKAWFQKVNEECFSLN